MHSPFTNLDFERFIYRQGQLLASRDFRDQQRMEAARRWMHNSAMHNAWGVAVGYEFFLSGTNQEKWLKNETLTIRPGVAYDCYGRELILIQTIDFTRASFEVAVGKAWEELLGQTYFLVLRYQESMDLMKSTDCLGSPGSVTFPPPLLLWKPKNEVCYGLEVPILIVSFPCEVESFPSEQTTIPSVQRYFASRARAQARPKIASGNVILDASNVRPWITKLDRGLFGFQVGIDTRDAGFQFVPCYFAWLIGWPFLPPLLGPFISLADEKPPGFTFRMLYFIQPQGPTSMTMLKSSHDVFRTLQAELLRSARLQAVSQQQTNVPQRPAICWLGIEP